MSLCSVALLFVAACTPVEDAPLRGEVSIAYVWSLAQERSVKIKHDIYVSGRVVLNDKLGEVSHCFVLADESGGLEVKVDSKSVDRYVPLYSDVTLRLSGLSIGRQGGKLVVGKHPTGEFVVDRVAEEEIFNHITLSTTADIAPSARRVTISDIELYDLLTYVRLDALCFLEADGHRCWCERDTLSGDYVTTVSHLTDGRDTLRVVVDGGCRYASEPLPSAVEHCYGIVDWHQDDIALRISNHRFLPSDD